MMVSNSQTKRFRYSISLVYVTAPRKLTSLNFPAVQINSTAESTFVQENHLYYILK
jgi:hypothetical protein